MNYEIDNPDEIIDFWLPVFEAISVEQFQKFCDILKFRIEINTRLREIARQFSISILNYLGRNIPEIPATVLLYNLSLEIDPIIQIWTSTFSQLTSIGYADEVYRWGKSINKSMHYPLNHKSFVTEWDILLIDWAHSPPNSEFLYLTLPANVCEKLKLIIKEYEAKQLDFRFQIKQIEEMATDAKTWEGYTFKTLKIGSWINNKVQYQVQLNKWKTIFSILSTNELDTLDKWGYANFVSNNAGNYFSLLPFAFDLNKSSLY